MKGATRRGNDPPGRLRDVKDTPRTDTASPPPAPRPCAVCGGPTRRSHVAYLGRDQEASVYRCASCGATSQGPPRDRAAANHDRAAQGRRREGRRPLDEGAPENPVLDSDLARLLREQFGDS